MSELGKMAISAVWDNTRHDTIAIKIILLGQLATLKIKRVGGGLIDHDRSKPATIKRCQCVVSDTTNLAKWWVLALFRDMKL